MLQICKYERERERNKVNYIEKCIRTPLDDQNTCSTAFDFAASFGLPVFLECEANV